MILSFLIYVFCHSSIILWVKLEKFLSLLTPLRVRQMFLSLLSFPLSSTWNVSVPCLSHSMFKYSNNFCPSPIMFLSLLTLWALPGSLPKVHLVPARTQQQLLPLNQIQATRLCLCLPQSPVLSGTMWCLPQTLVLSHTFHLFFSHVQSPWLHLSLERLPLLSLW